MCGGILEAGLIAAAVGFIGKKIHKCKCKCHDDEHKDCHNCHDDEHKKLKEKIIQKDHNSKKYNIIQKVFIVLSILGVFATGVGTGVIISNHLAHEQHIENCSHK